MKAIIGGTGFYQLNYLDERHSLTVRTPFGSVKIDRGLFRGQDLVFLPRHGPDHTLLANQVNYRANIWALHQLGVTRILGTSAVGSINPAMQVGDLVALEQLVDFSKRRQDTFNLGSVNMTEPYCPEMRQTIIRSGRVIGTAVHPQATYVSLDGPRYETAAEIRVYSKLGMDVVGMTNGTEAVLARELGMCYAVVAIVTNMAAGMSSTQPSLDVHKRVMEENAPRLRELALEALAASPEPPSCRCASLSAFRSTGLPDTSLRSE